MDPNSTGIGEPATKVEIRSSVLWALEAPAAVALLTCLYLWTATGAAGGSIGCGASSGCQTVLGSRWSHWLGIPVSALAVVVYGSIILASLIVGRSHSESRRRWGAAALIGGAFLAAAAAIWFVVLQALVIHIFCAYCMAVHSCGLLVGGWAIWNGGRLLQPVQWASAIAVSLVGVGLLIGGQLLAPPNTFQVDRAASFLVPGGRFDMTPGMAPTIGSPQAKHYIVMLSDYACPHCRQTHQVLEKTLAGYGGQIGVIVLPTPLDRKCNSLLIDSAPPEPQDCALNRLAIAVWCAEPDAFAAMDHWLMAADQSRLETEARVRAAELVGEAELAKAEKDPRVESVLRQDTQLYSLVKGGKLPQLLFGATHITGTLLDGEEIERAIEREWHLRPALP